MSRLSRLIIITMILFSFVASAQKEQTRNAIEIKFGLPAQVKPSKEYNTAVSLVDSALLKLKAGEVNQADALVRQSIAVYPTVKVFEYVRELCLMPDVNKANTIMDELYARAAAIPDEKIMLMEMSPMVTKDGKQIRGIRMFEKDRALFHFAYHISNMNKEFADVDRQIKSIRNALAIEIKADPKAEMDLEPVTQRHFQQALAMIEKDYDKAINIVKEISESAHYPIQVKNNMLISIYIEKGDYEKALDLNKTLTGGFESVGNKNNFVIHALLGNNDEALSYYKKYIDANPKYITNDNYYILAVLDINKGNYEAALVNLDHALHKKMEGILEGMEGLYVDKYKIYKTMGDAYTGLKQFDKAKDYYELSLLFYPDYEPSKMALMQLDSLITTTITTDKTAPEIKITEPVANRGLEIVSAGNDIMIKGIAADPSGLKSVTINGLAVYAQPDGNFWGNIPLNEGLNKITVRATDGAGNVAEQVFEIEKNSKEPVNEVVAATEREGKNYCLLIGAQNYVDTSIPSLENPIQDAVRLKIILKSDYNFEDSNIITLFNPEANDIRRQLLELTNIIQPEDNLLIFYAGHGIWVEKEKKGYWLLVDAKRNDPNTWLQNKDVLNLIAKLPSRHTLLITDACFSGGVFRTRSIGKDAPAAIQSMNEKISRVAITSGNDTEVPDESVFMKYLIKALTENKEQYLTAQKMFITQIMEAVMTETKTEPRYGTLELAGHVGGDYIFSKK